MKRLPLRTVAIAIAVACGCCPLAAQQADPGHAQHNTNHDAVDQEQMDHEHMDHGQTDHAGVDHSQHRGSAATQMPVPAITDADRLAAKPPSPAHAHGGDAIYSYSLINRLESWDADPGTALGWEAEGWIGGDINRLWWNTEG